MKTFSKVLIILLMTICMVAFLFQNVAFAEEAVDAQGALQKINTTVDGGKVEGTEGLSEMAGKIVVFLQVASGIAAVIMIAITGFRYVIETPEVKGELKKNMFPIIVGMILVFFALSIANFFLGMFTKSSGT